MPGATTSPAFPKYNWDIVVFKIEDRLFRVARQELEKESSIFAAMFSLPAGDAEAKIEGQTNENPIVLEGYKCEDFEALLRLLYPTFDDLMNGSIVMTKSQWTGVLKLSTIRKHAILRLSTAPFDLTPVEKITLGREHRVGPWLEEGLKTFVEGELDLSLDDLEAAVGLRTAYRIVGLRAIGNHGEPRITCLRPCLSSIVDAHYPTLPLGQLKCQYCEGSAFKVPFPCHNCGVNVPVHEDGHVWIKPSSDSLVKSNEWVVFYEIELRDIKCAAGGHLLIIRAIPCASCGRSTDIRNHVRFTLGPAGRASGGERATIRSTFEDEFKELEESV